MISCVPASCTDVLIWSTPYIFCMAIVFPVSFQSLFPTPLSCYDRIKFLFSSPSLSFPTSLDPFWESSWLPFFLYFLLVSLLPWFMWHETFIHTKSGGAERQYLQMSQLLATPQQKNTSQHVLWVALMIYHLGFHEAYWNTSVEKEQRSDKCRYKRASQAGLRPAPEYSNQKTKQKTNRKPHKCFTAPDAEKKFLGPNPLLTKVGRALLNCISLHQWWKWPLITDDNRFS